MKKLAFLLLFINATAYAQSYPPSAGEVGSTAIAADSQLFTSWATGVEITRGYIDISNTTAEDNDSNYASFGEPENAIGPATNTAVSLGDAGVAILTFDIPISDGPSFDFAVFENSFSDTFLELAFVEVSSDGINYFRFPSHSQTQTNTQIEGFGTIDASYINNLAGKYRALYGTPFDISELENNSLLDKNNITHIKIIDVVGSIDSAFGSIDSFGNVINDPFNTPFFSGGFDLDAVGVINEQVLSSNDIKISDIKIYPNPTSEKIYFDSQHPLNVEIIDSQGRNILKLKLNSNNYIDVSNLDVGKYFLKIIYNNNTILKRFLKK